MKKAIQYFIKYHISADVLILLIAILGIVSAINIQRSQFPRAPSRNIMVETTYIGASPSEVEKGITIKIEEEIDGLEGIKKVTSTSSENLSAVNIEIFSNYLVDDVIIDVKNAIDRVNTFPDNAETPIIYKQERIDDAATIMISGDVDLLTLKQFTEKAEKQLLAKKEISKVELSGYPEQEIEIAINEEALTTYNLTFEQLAQAVQGSNVEMTGGTLEMGNMKATVRAENKEYYAQQLENIIVKTGANGANVLLKDVATLQNQWEDVPLREYYDGKPATKIKVLSRLSEDIITTADASKKFIEEFNDENKVVQAYLLKDGSIGIQQRTDLLVENGLIGFVLVFILLGLFLKPRIAFWVALSIPISIAGMFFIMSMTSFNINMLSLFGLILVIGILVDDGVVIAENIFQKYEQGLPPQKAAIEGVMEVLPSVVSAVITTCWFFLLFFLIEGRLGDFMSSAAFVVITTLAFSLIEGFFILPAHIAHSKDLKAGNTNPNIMERSTTAFFNFLKESIYAPILRFCLANRTIALSIGVVALFLSVNFVKGGYVKVTFFPNIARDEVVIDLKLPAGTNEIKTNAILERIEGVAREVNKEFSAQRTDSLQVIRSIARSISRSSNQGSLLISLLDGETRNLESSIVANAIKERVGEVYEAESLNYGQKSIFGAAIQVGLVGDNMDNLIAAKDEIKAALVADKRLKNISDNDQQGGLEFNLELLPKANALGVDLRTVIRQIRQGYFGYEVQRLQRGTDEVKVWLRYTNRERESFESLLNMKIRVNNNNYPLKELVRLQPQKSSLQIAHLNSRAKMEVSADINESMTSATPTEVFNEFRDNVIPPILSKYSGVDVVYEGQSESAGDTINSMIRWLPIILLLVFFTVVLTFRSFLQALVVILLIPFSFIGVVAGHWIHGIPISILSLFGILAVAGVVINDSLVLVSTMNRFLKEGMPFKEAVLEASISRFRPIILTSVTTVAGLMPIVLETSLQAQFLIPMAIALAYGLASATFIMLLMLPPILSSVNSLKRMLHWIWEGEKISPEDVEPSIIEEQVEHSSINSSTELHSKNNK
jgi:multidrug efflux pump subunit AcrB